MMFSRAGLNATGDSGQSLVEFALLVPLLGFLLIGGVDLARAYAHQLAVQNGARAGAEAAAIDMSPTGAEAAARARDEMSATVGLAASDATITVTFAQANGLTPCVNPPSMATFCYATVRVQYTFRTLVPWLAIPTTAEFDRSNTMRMVRAP
jgi:Flp pilus assembly protein TadG